MSGIQPTTHYYSCNMMHDMIWYALSQLMSPGGDIMFIGPMCSWEIPNYSTSALAVIAGFLNTGSEINYNCTMISWKKTSQLI